MHREGCKCYKERQLRRSSEQTLIHEVNICVGLSTTVTVTAYLKLVTLTFKYREGKTENIAGLLSDLQRPVMKEDLLLKIPV